MSSRQTLYRFSATILSRVGRFLSPIIFLLGNGCHGGIMHRLRSRLCWLMHCGFNPNKGWTTLCCLYVDVCGSYLRCVTRNSHIHMGELTVWIVLPTVAMRMHRSSPLVPLDVCLTAAACYSSAGYRMFKVHSLHHKPVIWRF